MQGAVAGEENRIIVDRRNFGWRTVFFGFLKSRRRDSRRSQDGELVFTDWHHPWLFFLAICTMLFSSLDAFLTLQLISHGAYEANPFMLSMMNHSTATFAATKMALTGVGILTLVFLARSRFMNRIPTGAFLTVTFSLYACLICYELVHWLNFN